MSDLVLVLFDDRVAREWMPFALTRPAGELRFGALTLRERAERVFRARCLGHLTLSHLRPFDEPWSAPVLDPAQLPRDRNLLFLSSRAVPAWQGPPALGDQAALLGIGGEVCGWYAPAGTEPPPAEFLLDPAAHAPSALPVQTMAGAVLQGVWELVTRNAEQVARDVTALFPRADGPQALPAGVHVLGSAPLILGRDVTIEPGVVLDLREGPVWLDDESTVCALTRLAGPAYIGRKTELLGGRFSAVSIGPMCKVHGEVEESVFLGYANKAHDGFLGHAYVGCWVNLGALTTNSDLKNNYGPVRLWTPNGEADTGELKFGCLLGDHVRTGIGIMLNTGTVVGAGACIFGASQPPKYVPPFAWGTGDSLGEYELEKFLATAETVMARRNVVLTPGQRELLRAAWDLGRNS
jgi:UDP-N-acetylglucosamine diphosphorylase/glucosamine-1-phosphate N-acetyltransferase